MKGVCLKFYAHEKQKHLGLLVYEWLLEFAKRNNIQGGSVFRGIAGYGRHGILYEEHFFELTSNVPIEIVFILSEEEANQFLLLLRKETLDLMYVKIPVEYGALNDEKK